MTSTAEYPYTCSPGDMCMSDSTQFITGLIALFVVSIAVLGVWSIVRDIVAHDQVEQLKDEVADTAAVLYCCDHHGLAPEVHLPHVKREVQEPRLKYPPQLISPSGLRWLQSKLPTIDWD